MTPGPAISELFDQEAWTVVPGFADLEGRDAFLEKREPNWAPYPWQ
jgi:1,4-dihydroxy-2-naphthoyl-CoA synthase